MIVIRRLKDGQSMSQSSVYDDDKTINALQCMMMTRMMKRARGECGGYTWIRGIPGILHCLVLLPDDDDDDGIDNNDEDDHNDNNDDDDDEGNGEVRHNCAYFCLRMGGWVGRQPRPG